MHLPISAFSTRPASYACCRPIVLSIKFVPLVFPKEGGCRQHDGQLMDSIFLCTT